MAIAKGHDRFAKVDTDLPAHHAGRDLRAALKAWRDELARLDQIVAAYDTARQSAMRARAATRTKARAA